MNELEDTNDVWPPPVWPEPYEFLFIQLWVHDRFSTVMTVRKAVRGPYRLAVMSDRVVVVVEY